MMRSGQRMRTDVAVQGVKPAGPVDPVEPVEPVEPVGPVVPEGPIEPPEPVGLDCAKIVLAGPTDGAPIATAITAPAAKRDAAPGRTLRSRTDTGANSHGQVETTATAT
jgi:hypothetical protein